MSEFIAGLFCGAIVMFFAVSWLYARAVEQIEPLDEYDLLATPGADHPPIPNE